LSEGDGREEQGRKEERHLEYWQEDDREELCDPSDSRAHFRLTRTVGLEVMLMYGQLN
jgi:hypothetical protein